MDSSILITSLDFELFWGMQDSWKLEDYIDNVMGARAAIPNLLKLFQSHSIHTTWATVGFMFADSYAELMHYFPDKSLWPSYDNEKLLSYRCFDSIGENEQEAPCFYAPSLIKLISETEGQEIGTHTFSHYYCNAPGQTVEQFKADMIAASKIIHDKGHSAESLVFPRNNSGNEYVKSLKELGVKAYRSLDDNWINRNINDGFFERLFRLIDVYIPITGQGGYIPKKRYGVWDFTGSRMYKPYFKPLAFLEGLKVRRIKKQMLHAAKNNLVFHLWWHPHNIGVKTDFHFKQLEEIFSYYDELREKYGMRSMNMKEAAEYFSKNS